jgi:hypothetical protein
MEHNVELLDVATRMLETYTLEEILEINNIEPERALETLIEAGLIDIDLPMVII